MKRADISTEHGLDASALLWADDGELVLSYGQYRGGEGDDPMQQSSATPSEHYWWRLDQDRPQELPMPEGTRRADLVGASGGRVVLTDSTRYWCYYLDQPGFAWPMLGEAGLAMSTQPVFLTTSRFAVVRGSWNPNSILVGDASLRGGAAPHGAGLAGHLRDPRLGRRPADRRARHRRQQAGLRQRLGLPVDSRTGWSVESSGWRAPSRSARSRLPRTCTTSRPLPEGTADPVRPAGRDGRPRPVAVPGAGAVVVWRRRVEA